MNEKSSFRIESCPVIRLACLSAEADVLPVDDGDPLGGEAAGGLEGEVSALGRAGHVAVGPREPRVPVAGRHALHLERVAGDLSEGGAKTFSTTSVWWF